MAISIPIPLRDQLNEPVVDGQPDENKNANCVPSSLSSPVTYYTGRVMYGDELKDLVYGQSYTGGTDPLRYKDELAKLGVEMDIVTADPTEAGQWVLINAIKDALSKGHVVSCAIPSMWGNTTWQQIDQTNASTHEVTICGWDQAADTFTAMNPWHGFFQTMSVFWWQSRIVYHRVFPLKGTRTMPYTLQSNGDLLYTNGVRVIGFMAQHILDAEKAGHPITGTPFSGEIWPAGALPQEAAVGILCFDDGTILSIHRDANGNYGPVLTTEGGKLLQEFLTRPAPQPVQLPPPPVDPKLVEAKAFADASVAAQKALSAYEA